MSVTQNRPSLSRPISTPTVKSPLPLDAARSHARLHLTIAGTSSRALSASRPIRKKAPSREDRVALIRGPGRSARPELSGQAAIPSSALGAKGPRSLGPPQRIAVAFAKRGQAHDRPAWPPASSDPSAKVVLVPGRPNEQLLAVLLDPRAEFVNVPLPDLIAMDLALGLLASLDRVVDDPRVGRGCR